MMKFKQLDNFYSLVSPSPTDGDCVFSVSRGISRRKDTVVAKCATCDNQLYRAEGELPEMNDSEYLADTLDANGWVSPFRCDYCEKGKPLVVGKSPQEELLEVFEEMLEDYKLACDEWCDETEDYGLELIEKAEKVLEKVKNG